MISTDAGLVRVRVARTGEGLLFGADAPDRASAEDSILRVRFSLGADDDLRQFVESFRDDPLIGRSIRRNPGLRPHRRPRPWEALAWAITEQLIEYKRAAAIQRRLVRRIGPRSEVWGLSDVPSAAAIADLAPAEIVSFDLAESRAQALRRVARAVAAGKIDFSAKPEAVSRRIQSFPGLGRWTADITALHGLGDLSVVPAGDLGYLKAVGRHLSGGDPKGFATEDEVREFFRPYAPWGGLAAAHFLAG
jgi:3-methyladenine DNA glycosylase/8-oxoguanine DNA glycosylase